MKSLHYSPYQLAGSTPVAILLLQDCHVHSFNLDDTFVTSVETDHVQELTSVVKPVINKSIYPNFSIATLALGFSYFQRECKTSHGKL